MVAAVRGYLHTLKLSEKDLSAGITIPFGYPASDCRAQSCTVVGTAKATGQTGPQGHQVYEVVEVASSERFGWTTNGKNGEAVGGSHRFTEIPPEPEAAPAVQAPSAPTAR
jgi:hypothetical protein